MIMKKIILTLIVSALAIAANAKVIVITLENGQTQVVTSSEISSIDFGNNGTVKIATFDGKEYLTTTDKFKNITIGEGEEITDEEDFTMEFGYNGITLSTREAHRINFVYPTTDPWGKSISMSGQIVIPENIYKGEAKCEGIMLFNHFTIFNKDEAPTRGYFQLEGFFMANPLNLNYIVVESDFYGFGATERFPQAYVQGGVNGNASLDCLLAARRILDKQGFNYGPLTFNLGYSSGGFDAMATQKQRDMEYSDRISFDKTFAGGGPYDLKEAYVQYVTTDETAYNAVLPLLMVSTNETQGMELNYDDVFYPYVSNKIDEWILSKKYSSWPVCDSIGREKKVHEILMPPYCDLESDESMAMQNMLEQLSIATGWVPDPTQKLYIMHSRDDDYVPVQSARNILGFLQKNGYTASTIPGKTNLQTNFVVKKLGHLTGMLVYLAQSAAALKAWPVMYTDGQLNPAYQAILNSNFDAATILHQMEDAGIDVREMINNVLAPLAGGDPSNIDLETIKAQMAALAAQAGIDLNEVLEMLADSGYDLEGFITDVIAYLNQPTEEPESAPADRLLRAFKSPAMTPADQYEQQLMQWFQDNGIE